MERVTYSIEDAYLVELLGRQSFAHPYSAILELVKNAYDAGATSLIISFHEDSVVLKDNGCGMSAQDIRTHWMQVGNSSKGYEIVDIDGEKRVLSGSKGIGRFALVYLGDSVTLLSKTKSESGVKWTTSWEESFLDKDESLTQGTQIIINGLRSKWNKKTIEGLLEYLSRSYRDTRMEIIVACDGENKVVHPYFDKPRLGYNCVQIINVVFDAKELSLLIDIESDEFKQSAQKLTRPTNIKNFSVKLNAVDELRNQFDFDNEEELIDALRATGPFQAQLYFRLKNISSSDSEEFLYKYSKLEKPYENGIVLYRNAFSIYAFDGSKDWLDLGRRARRSPASPSHETGAWRVRENQVAGFVLIDKQDNPLLKDLANRQGLEENEQYTILVALMRCSLTIFERYRQGLIRSIKSSTMPADKNEGSQEILNLLLAKKIKLGSLSDDEQDKLFAEVVSRVQTSEEEKKEFEEKEKQHRYDVRILNVLATLGLKSASVAHQLKNEENIISGNSRHVREALQAYGLWNEVSKPEHRKIAYRDIPTLLEDGERINKKMSLLVRTMLNEIEKQRFKKETCDFDALLNQLSLQWTKDYPLVSIDVKVPQGLMLAMPEDAVKVVFDNLILNSIQQNENTKTDLLIDITADVNSGYIAVIYRDNGVGLDNRYKRDPFRILEVHESTRKNGHGLGMWILNNTLHSYGCEVLNISSSKGFELIFTLRV